MSEEIICDTCKEAKLYIKAKRYFKTFSDNRPIKIHAACGGHLGLYSIFHWADISVDEYLRYQKLQAFT